MHQPKESNAGKSGDEPNEIKQAWKLTAAQLGLEADSLSTSSQHFANL
jgi:hypothetical protein